METSENRVEGVVLDERLSVTLTELSQLCDSEGQTLRLMVTEGLLHPCGRDPSEWRFSGIEIRRARRALRLRRDLELDLPGTALALDLLDEIESLRERVRVLEQRFRLVSQ